MRIPIFLAVLQLASLAHAADWNSAVLTAVKSMPRGGGYSVSSKASDALSDSVRISKGRLLVSPRTPSYCSGATYLVLLRVISNARNRGELRIGEDQLRALLPAGQRDGDGVWGRWNANGPGAARLFYELGLGRNFTSFNEARPGDFLKIFWRDAVGASERGHLVIYLGTESKDGEEFVKYWSSNQPEGFGVKSVARSKIARALFSRLEAPERLQKVMQLKPTDAYLAGLLKKESSFAEACRLTGAN